MSMAYRFSSSCQREVSSWLQSIVDYVKDTQASCLDLRTMPEDIFKSVSGDSFTMESTGVDIEPILDSLVGSSITEIHMENQSLTYQGQSLFKILPETNVEKLNFCPHGVKLDGMLSLMATLKDTKITDLVIDGKGHALQNNQVDELVAHLVNSHVRSLELRSIPILPAHKISVLFENLSSTQITCLDLSALLSYPNEDFTELLQILMSNIQHTLITDLNLAMNKLHNPSAVVIGASLENSKLERLNLSNNQLTGSGINFLIPGLIRSKIFHLNMGGNMIDNAFDKLGHCLKDTKIRELNLSGNPYSDERFFQVLRFIPYLNLDRDNIRSTTEKMVPPLSIKEVRISELTHLDLSYNKLNLEKISALADYLSNSELTHLSLFKNILSIKGFNILGESVKKSKLECINLGGTAYLLESEGAIASFLENTKGSTILSINLKENYLFHSVDIIPTILASTTFLELDLSSNGWRNHIVSLSQHLKSTHITALYLGFNEIGDSGAKILSECLLETQIVLLDLRRNEITSIGAKALALALKTSKLRHLNLGLNKIDDDGLESLAEHAENSCITYLNVSLNPGQRKLLVDRVLWDNRRKIQQFVDLLKQTAFFTGDSNVFEFDRDFESINIEVFLEDCLKVYKMVSKEPFIVGAIEQDKSILELKKLKWCKFKSEYSEDVFFEDCELICNKILEHPSTVQGSSEESKEVSFVKKRILWLILEYFPTKFVSFVGRSVEADVEQHVSLLRKIEELELTHIVELLLLNRPVYVIDKDLDILHPYVYKLLFKYKQTICNTEIEPEGMEKIIQYFTKHIKMKYALEVIMFLNISKLQKV